MKSILKVLSIIIIMALILGACSNNVVETTTENKVDSNHEDVIKLIKDNEYLMENYPDLFPVNRTTEGIVLDSQESAKFDNTNFELDFYRNTTYDAGLEGKYTFLVINPANNPNKEAPLWVYFHGGGGGYFDENGEYLALTFQDEMTWNKEETYEKMLDPLLKTRLYKNGELKDNTLIRRIKEGYRLLVVSYSDHDYYAGIGSEYPNNPNGGQVNGLQASMSAVDYVTQNYATTYVFAHGTSAGAIGAYVLGVSYFMEGIHLTGIISDSMLPTSKMEYIMDEFAGHDEFKHEEGFNYEGMIEKVGAFGDEQNQLLPASMIEKGFNIPMLGIGGRIDPFYADHIYTHPIAKEEGFETNMDWLHSDIISAIENQENSPHKVVIFDDTGHVPTVSERNHSANNYVDAFIEDSKAYNNSYPFAKNISDEYSADAQFTVETYVYKESFGQEIDLDFYRPVESDYDELPVLVFYHGGGYKGGTKGDAARMFDEDVRGQIREEYLRNGYAVVSCNYIVTDKDMGIDIGDCWIDGKDSIRWVRKNAEMLGIDANNIGAMGSSAGGGMATMLGYTENNQFIGDADLSGYSSSVNYVINMWGAAHYNVEPMDYMELETLDGLSTDDLNKMYRDLYRIGLSEDDDWATIKERRMELTPTTYLDAGDVPTISFYGEDDVTTHASQGIYLHGVLGEMGITNQLFIYEDQGHGLKSLSSSYVEQAKIAAFEFGHRYYKGQDMSTKSTINTNSSLDLTFTKSPFDLGNIDAKFSEDISYDEYDETKFDIFMPISEEPTGLVIYIHGGGFKTGDKAKLYASRGNQNLIKELLS